MVSLAYSQDHGALLFSNCVLSCDPSQKATGPPQQLPQRHSSVFSIDNSYVMKYTVHESRRLTSVRPDEALF
jgi:hypothetical protein